MKKYFVLIVGITVSVLLAMSTTQSSAQQQQREAAPDPDMRIQVERMQGPEMMPPMPPPGDFLFLSTEMAFGGRLVKGAPYSAQAISETTQNLSDGNRIVTKSTAALYRDSEGRTRREQTLKAIGPFSDGGEPAQTIFIDDPVAGVSYALDPRTHIAQKMPPMRFKFELKVPGPGGEGAVGAGHGGAVGVGQANASVGQMRVGVGPAEVPPPDRMEIERSMSARRVAEPRLMWGWRNHESRSESLGKQSIEGVEADGTRSTVTIPAGEIGNERPIEIVNERWYSPELQTVVMTRHSDPRFGEASYRLTNIDRSEPVKSLFEVPADYKVQAGFGMGVGSGGGSGVGHADTAGGTYRATAPAAGDAVIHGGVLNGKAISLPQPPYPSIAKQARASGKVIVDVVVDEDGNVISARGASGHPLLQGPAVAAARQAKFAPTTLSGQPVKVQGVLIYTFPAE